MDIKFSLAFGVYRMGRHYQCQQDGSSVYELIGHKVWYRLASGLDELSFEGWLAQRTAHQHYPFFYLHKVELALLTPEQLSNIYAQPYDSEMYKVFWPKEGYVASTIDKKGLLAQLQQALEDENMEEMMRIKKQMKEMGI